MTASRTAGRALRYAKGSARGLLLHHHRGHSLKYLPIPKAPPEDQAALSRDAERLQALHDQRRQALADIAARMGSVRIRPRPVEWLFPGLPDLDELKGQAPKRPSA